MRGQTLRIGGLLLAAICTRGSAQPPAESDFGTDRAAPVRTTKAEILPPIPAGNPVSDVMPAETRPEYRLSDLLRLALENNPRLAQAEFVIEAARGRALQAGLYPNPVISANFDELGDRTGPQGVNTIPLVTQEIVTGSKLSLSRAAAMKEVDQATFALATRRAELLAAVRSALFDVMTLKRRIELLGELKDIARNDDEEPQPGPLVVLELAGPFDVITVRGERHLLADLLLRLGNE